MRLLACLFFWLAAMASAAPMQFREVELLLQSGISPSEIIRDVQSRKLIQPPTEAEIRELGELGATPPLIAAMKAAGNALSPENAAREATAQNLRRRVIETETEKQKLAAQVATLPRTLIYGKVFLSRDDGYLIYSEPASVAHPTTHLGVQPSKVEIVHVKPGPGWSVNQLVEVIASPAGTYPSVDGSGKAVRYPSFDNTERLPVFSKVTAVNRPTQTGQARTVLASASAPVTRRTTLPGNRMIHLIQFGGPNQHMMLTDIQMTYIKVRFQHMGNAQTIPIESRGRTLIHDDQLGCKTYYLDEINRPSGQGIFEFQHTADSNYHPDKGIGGDGEMWPEEKMRIRVGGPKGTLQMK